MPLDAAAEAFCASEYPRLVRALTLYVGDVHLAEELAQEALLRACRDWSRVGRLDSPGGWAWHVARNLAASHFRRARAARRAHRRLEHEAGAVHRDPEPTDVVALRRAAAALPERQRHALVLRHVLDLTVDDTAARMGISADAVKSLSKRATAALRQELGLPQPTLDREARDAR